MKIINKSILKSTDLQITQKIHSDDGKGRGDFLPYLSIVIAPFKKCG